MSEDLDRIKELETIMWRMHEEAHAHLARIEYLESILTLISIYPAELTSETALHNARELARRALERKP